MKAATFFSILLLNFATVGLGHAQRVHTYVDADSLQAGDLFTYTIVFNGNYESIDFPADDAFSDNLAVKSIQRYQPSTSKDSLVYTLQFFGIEDISIPEKSIRIQSAEGDTTIFTNPVPLFFKTTLAEGEDEFRPMKPIYDFARIWWPYILGVILLIAFAVYLFRWLKTRETPEEPEPVEPPPPFSNPLQELKKTISSLSDVSSLQTDEEYESFYVELGDAIRLYLKRVYGFHALEMTTTEIVMSLQKEHAPPKIISITRKVLNEADIVKFANFNPGQEGAKSAWQTARQFIETAEVVNREQIQYMKYKYEVEHGIVNGNPKEMEREES